MRWLASTTLLIGLLACESSSTPAPPPTGATAVRSAPSASVSTSATPSAPPSVSAAPKPPPPPAGPPEGMVKIPAGIFMMGAPFNLGNPEEKPRHEAPVASFFMDVHEVTLKAYLTCKEEGACEHPHTDRRFCNTKFEGRENHPVNCVDLRMAAAFCTWAGKRLPTEREWEYAASGGAEQRIYSWGNSPPPSMKNNCYDHPGGSCPIKSFEPGAFGLYDMTGNMWEWTQSRFDPYPSTGKLDRISDRTMYAYRGGSWSRRFAKWMRTELRNRYEPDKYSASIGMRCVKDVAPLECPPQTEAKDGVCVRTSGTPSCEKYFAWDAEEKSCQPTPDGKAAHLAGRWPPADNPAKVNLAKGGGPLGGSQGSAAGAPSISRSRTPQHDADCKQHWPATPASYLFTGGNNYPSRKPAVAAAGCVPRDMSWGWTSACCAQ